MACTANRNGFVLVILIGLLGTQIVASEARAHSTVRFRKAGGLLPVVSVFIDGRGPYDFAVDTGTNTTLVDPAVAADLALNPVDRMFLTTPTATSVLPRYFLDSVALGSESVAHLEALSEPLTQVQVVAPQVRGVLGLNFLLQFSFQIDYRRGEIALFTPNESAQAAGGTRVQAVVADSGILVPVATRASRTGEWKLALDSGIPRVLVFEDRIALRSEDDSAGKDISFSPVAVATNNASLQGVTVTLSDVTIAEMHLTALSVVVLPGKESPTKRLEDGLLPSSLFHAVFFDRALHSVVLDPVAVFATLAVEKGQLCPRSVSR